MVRSLSYLILTLLLALAGKPAFAQRPMLVEDAVTADKGKYYMETGLSKDHYARGWDALIGCSLIESLETEIGLERIRDYDQGSGSRTMLKTIVAKWVPEQNEDGLSAGLKFKFETLRFDADTGPTENEHSASLLGLASWRFESGQFAHINLGSNWIRAEGTNTSIEIWGLGFEQPLRKDLRLTLEVYRFVVGKPDRQIGLQWDLTGDMTLSAGLGRGNGRSFSNVAIGWEF